MKMLMIRSAALALLVALSMFAAACGQEQAGKEPTGVAGEDVTGTASVDTVATQTSPTSPDSPGGTAVVPEVESGAPVAVVIEDGRIVVPEKVGPGPLVMTVKNSGAAQHNLAVEGPNNVAKELPMALEPGQEGSMEIVLAAGQYRAYCPILNHHAEGENVTFTVAP